MLSRVFYILAALMFLAGLVWALLIPSEARCTISNEPPGCGGSRIALRLAVVAAASVVALFLRFLGSFK